MVIPAVVEHKPADVMGRSRAKRIARDAILDGLNSRNTTFPDAATEESLPVAEADAVAARMAPGPTLASGSWPNRCRRCILEEVMRNAGSMEFWPGKGPSVLKKPRARASKRMSTDGKTV